MGGRSAEAERAAIGDAARPGARRPSLGGERPVRRVEAPGTAVADEHR